jgi:hypothetical protein
MRVLRLLVCLSLFAATACGGPEIDLTKGLEVVDIRTGWHDAGIVNGQNKLVPTVTFKLKNVSGAKLKVLRANAVFRQVGNSEEWSSGYAEVRGSEGLAPGELTDAITLTASNGYTGMQDRAEEMLTHKEFVDARFELFAKYSSKNWSRIAEQMVDRRLLN